MAAVEIEETLWVSEPRVAELRLVSVEERRRPSLSERRAAKARRLRRRNRILAGAALVVAVAILAVPGTSFGGVTDTGLPTDVATSAVLAPGTVYLVQSGDTLSAIAQRVNPLNVAKARAALVHELGSNVVVPGEHVLIP
ncbi:MAG TPA: LysM peptidoglycan-binding domain-containing protein [Acidimicrobiales bacterium]|jgi:LysM repeat protein